MAVSRSVGTCWLRRAQSMALWYWDQACLSCSGGIFRGGGKPWSASSGGWGGRLGMVRRRCRGLWLVGPSGRGPYRASTRMMGLSSAVFWCVGFVRDVCDCDVGVVRQTHQAGEEGVGRVGRVVPLDVEGQGQCHEEVQEGAFCSSLGDALPGSRKGVSPAPVRTVYLWLRMYLEVKL